MPAQVPLALVYIVLQPKTVEDFDRLTAGLNQLTSQIGGVRLDTNEQAGEVVIGAADEEHLEIIVDRLAREFKVAANVGQPQIVYKAVLTVAAEGVGRYKRQSGGRGEYAQVKIRVLPRARDAGFEFDNQIVNGQIPQQFIEPMRMGIERALSRGVRAGYPIDDVRVELFDGSYHEIDSSERAFASVGSMALQDAAKRAKPKLLEPVMCLEVIAPRQFIDEVMRDLSARQATIESHDQRGDMNVVRAKAPFRQLLLYAADLCERTHGRASCVRQFAGYEPVDDPDARSDPDAPVGVPRRPVPPMRTFGVSLPAPDED
jgi:elongation factor G